MKKRMMAALSNMWLWFVLIVVGGCATVEGLRQCAHVERIRAQQQQQRADEIVALAAQAQNVMPILKESVPEDDQSGMLQLLDGLEKSQAMIVERAVDIQSGAKRSEEWQTADAEVVGQPKQAIEPDTPAEDDARVGFQSRARTAARIRSAATSLKSMVTGLPIRAGAQSGSSNGGLVAALIGTGVMLLGGGGAGVLKVRKVVRAISQTAQSVAQKDQERDEKESIREDRHSELERQMSELTNLVAQVQQSLQDAPTQGNVTAAPDSSSPSVPG